MIKVACQTHGALVLHTRNKVILGDQINGDHGQ